MFESHVHADDAPAIELFGSHDFKLAFGIARTYLAKRLGPMRGAAVGKIIAINRSDYCVGEIQMTHCFGSVTRFFGIERARCAFAYRAKSAVSRADIAAQHK